MGNTRSIAQVAGASLIGNALEWYDFFIETVAALVFNELFFPQVSPLIGTLAASVTFGVLPGRRDVPERYLGRTPTDPEGAPGRNLVAAAGG